MQTKFNTHNLKPALDRWLGGTLVVLMGLSVVNVLWQVFTRFVLNAPSSFTEELARYLLIWIGVLGAGYAVGQRVHLALELLPEKLSGRRRQVLELVIEACVIAFALFVMVTGGLRLMYIQLQLGQTSPTLQIPLGYVYAVLPLSGILMIVYAALHMTEQVRRLRTGRPAPETEDETHGQDTMPSEKEERPPVPE